MKAGLALFILLPQWLFALYEVDPLVSGKEIVPDTSAAADTASCCRGADSLDSAPEAPHFLAYRENYFLFGLGEHQASKFQFSFKYRFVQPMKTERWGFGKWVPTEHFYLTYTQKGFWDLWLYSAPFRENNYNPSLTYAYPLTRNKYWRSWELGLAEHESDGMDGENSRSWNRSYLAGEWIFPLGWNNSNFYLRPKAWVPWVVSEENEDILDYYGLGEFQARYSIPFPEYTSMLNFDMLYRKGLDSDWSRSGLQLGMQTRLLGIAKALLGIRKQSTLGLLTYAQYWVGYGESLLTYNEYTETFRIGILLAP